MTGFAKLLGAWAALPRGVRWGLVAVVALAAVIFGTDQVWQSLVGGS